MKNEQDKIIKAREFCQKVKELANEYGLSFFVTRCSASHLALAFLLKIIRL